MTRPSPSFTTARMLVALKFRSANAVQRLNVTVNVSVSASIGRDGLRGHVLIEHCVTVRRPHEPPRRIRPFAILVRPLARAGGHGLVDPMLMDDGIPDLIGCARVPRRGVVFRHGAGQQPDGLRLYELHARTPGIPSASHASTMSDVRRENLAISDMEMSMSRRSW